MNTSYVSWSQVILCLLLCCVECRPSVKRSMKCASHVHHSQCGNFIFTRQYLQNSQKNSQISFLFCSGLDIEDFMHPTFSRNKRTKHNMNTLMNDNYDETSSVFWQKRAQYLLRNHISKERNENIAKNVIFFLGDGMSIPTITAARIYLGQTYGTNGEDNHLSFEHFPYVGLSKVRAMTNLMLFQ